METDDIPELADATVAFVDRVDVATEVGVSFAIGAANNRSISEDSASSRVRSDGMADMAGTGMTRRRAKARRVAKLAAGSGPRAMRRSLDARAGPKPGG